MFYRDCRKALELCDGTPMAEVFDIQAVRDSIERLMSERKIKRKPLAQRAGLGETVVRDIFNPDRQDMKVSTLVKLAEFFEVPVDQLAGRERVYLAGKVGAGGAILFEENPDPIEVPRPPAASGRLMALQVQGDSMLPRYDEGDIIYVKREHEGVLPQYIGYHCVVHLQDGGTFLKVLEEGTEKGRYTLYSHNAPPMKNVEVVWASPVLFVMPRRSLPQHS